MGAHDNLKVYQEKRHRYNKEQLSSTGQCTNDHSLELSSESSSDHTPSASIEWGGARVQSTGHIYRQVDNKTSSKSVASGNTVKNTNTQVFTIAWDEEKTLCIIVSYRDLSIARRCDNNMINGTKLLNASGMTRGRRDGILKGEAVRCVTKSGATHLKGVWIPFERAKDIADRERISLKLYPLFQENIENFLYHRTNILRTQQVVRAAQQRNPVFGKWLNGIPKGFQKALPESNLSKRIGGNAKKKLRHMRSRVQVPYHQLQHGSTSSLSALVDHPSSQCHGKGCGSFKRASSGSPYAVAAPVSSMAVPKTEFEAGDNWNSSYPLKQRNTSYNMRSRPTMDPSDDFRFGESALAIGDQWSLQSTTDHSAASLNSPRDRDQPCRPFLTDSGSLPVPRDSNMPRDHLNPHDSHWEDWMDYFNSD